VFSLAALAYRALTGRVPFSGDNMEAALHAVLTLAPTPASRLVPLPPGVDDVLAIAMAKQPSARFGSAGALAAALGSAAREGLDPALRALARELAPEFATVTRVEATRPPGTPPDPDR
jgi:serine/threonine-protein kinase